MMKILIKSSDFNCESDNKYQRLQAIIDYVNALQEGLYSDEELDANIPQALEVYFVDYYVCQVDNGGLTQYFQNSIFSEAQNADVFRGLKNMKAFKNYAIFDEACKLLLNMDEDSRENYLFSGIYDFEKVIQMPGIKDVHQELQRLTNLFFSLNESNKSIESINDLNFEYIERISDLKIVNDDDYDQELNKILSAVPDYQKRRAEVDKEWAENMPRYYEIAYHFCDKYSLDFLSVNALSYGEGIVDDQQAKQNYQDEIIFYHISTTQGYYYIIDYGDRCVIVDGETNVEIGSM